MGAGCPAPVFFALQVSAGLCCACLCGGCCGVCVSVCGRSAGALLCVRCGVTVCACLCGCSGCAVAVVAALWLWVCAPCSAVCVAVWQVLPCVVLQVCAVGVFWGGVLWRCGAL